MILVEPASSVAGDVAVPAVKGLCQRTVLLAAIADGTSEISGFSHAQDTDSAVSAARLLGARVEEPSDGTLRVEGRGLRGLVEPAEPVDCGNAGTVLRLLAGILAGQDGRRFVLTGDASLSARDHQRIATPLSRMGAEVTTTNGGAPVRVAGALLRPIDYALPMASAQVKSAILLAGLLAQDGPTTVREPAPTRDHTERLLRSLGVRVRSAGRTISVWPVDRLPPLRVAIAGDFSSAAPFLVAATLLPGSRLRVHDVNLNPTRTGFLDVLERMGARITVFDRRTAGGEPVGSIEVESAELVATEIAPEEVPNVVDEIPLFALAASMARGESTVRGAEELRRKESDRIETVTAALRAIGGRVESGPDWLRIRGVPTRLVGGRVRSEGDHRIAMLGGVAGILSREGVRVEDAQAAAVSFPGFFELLDAIARRVEPGRRAKETDGNSLP